MRYDHLSWHVPEPVLTHPQHSKCSLSRVGQGESCLGCESAHWKQRIFKSLSSWLRHCIETSLWVQVLTLTQELVCDVVVFPWAPGKGFCLFNVLPWSFFSIRYQFMPHSSGLQLYVTESIWLTWNKTITCHFGPLSHSAGGPNTNHNYKITSGCQCAGSHHKTINFAFCIRLSFVKIPPLIVIMIYTFMLLQ